MQESSASLFGSYRLLEPLGEGGMGIVWKAMDLNLERVVALKLLRGSDESRRKALIQEAKTASQLNHPNIAMVFDAGETGGVPYIVMEFVEGRSLKDRVGPPLPEQELREMLFQAAGGMHHAHQRGIVHRDIKPENLIVTAEGTLKILDFGVAKRNLPHARESTGSGFTMTGETGQGFSVGTPAYMSPEQAYGLPLGPATDQFSLGVVLFELATGSHPFRKDTVLDTLHAIAKDPLPNPREVRPDLSPEFLIALRRMLEKRPEDRFPNLQVLLDFVAHQGRHREHGKLKSLPAPRRFGRRWEFGLAAAGLAIAGFLGYQVWSHANASTKGLGRGRKVVAILPLELLGVPGDKHWLATSLQDAMASRLLKRGDLLVLDRVRVAEALAKVGGGAERMGMLAQELNAEVLVLGTLQSGGSQVKLSLRMIKGKGGEILSSLAVTGDSSDSLALEDEMGQRLLALFGGPGTLQGEAPGSRAHFSRTRELYARAIELWDSGRLEDSQEGVRLLEQAARSEPSYAPVRAGLAWILLEMEGRETHLGRPEAKAHMTQAVEEARLAVELDPSLPMAHRVLGQALLRTGDLEGARRESQRAVELDPADFRAWIALADAYAYGDDTHGRELARGHYLRALELFPGDWWANFRLATLLQNDGELAEAVKFADRSRELRPSAEYAHLTAGVSLLWMGQLGEASKRLEEGIRETPASGLLRATQAILDFARKDAASFRARNASLAGAWPDSHPVSVLLKGLGEGLDDNVEGMEKRFLAFAAASQKRKLDVLGTGERRTASVNAYHMARALAQMGRKDAAFIVLAEADRLHPGKQKVAKADSVLRKLL